MDSAAEDYQLFGDVCALDFFIPDIELPAFPAEGFVESLTAPFPDELELPFAMLSIRENCQPPANPLERYPLNDAFFPRAPSNWHFTETVQDELAGEEEPPLSPAMDSPGETAEEMECDAVEISPLETPSNSRTELSLPEPLPHTGVARCTLKKAHRKLRLRSGKQVKYGHIFPIIYSWTHNVTGKTYFRCGCGSDLLQTSLRNHEPSKKHQKWEKKQ